MPKKPKKRLLHVLGAGPWQVPTVQLAQALGFRVLVTDMYAQRPAYAIADLHEVVDITDRDGTLAAARRHAIDGILCDSTDVGVPTAAFVADALGLPGMGAEVALNCTNKSRMRQLTSRCPASGGVRHQTLAGAEEVSAALGALGLPLVIKPADNQSGRGVQIVRDPAQALPAFEHALSLSRSGRVLLEQHLSGTELIVDGFVTDGDVVVLAVAVKTPYADNATISSRIHYPLPADLPLPLADVQQAARRTIGALGLRQGVFHAEFMVTPGGVLPVDVAARGGGVLIYRHVLPHVCGVNVNRAMIELAMGQQPVIQPRAERRCANIEFLRMPAGHLEAILGLDEAQAVADVAATMFNTRPGDVVGPLCDKDQRAGYIVALSDSSAAAIEACAKAKSLLRVRMQGRDELFNVT